MESEVAAFIASHRIARLATADAKCVPHAIPVCYVFDGKNIYSALDLKPKKVEGRQLKRVRNIIENSSVALVIDDYSEDWKELAYVLIQGKAGLIEVGEEQNKAESLLREKYPQYQELLEEACPIIRIMPENVVSWGKLF